MVETQWYTKFATPGVRIQSETLVRNIHHLLEDLAVTHVMHFGKTSDTHTHTSSSQRMKRWSLFPVAGEAFSGLFGLATQREFKQYTDHLNFVSNVLHQQGKIVNVTVQTINHQIDLLTDITNRIHKIETALAHGQEALKDLISQLNSYNMIIELQNMFDQLALFAGKYHDLIQDISLAAKGIVAPTLLSPLQLIEILNSAKIQFHLDPIIDINMIAHYYPLLKATLTSKFVLITIPFKNSDFYSIYKLHSFPVWHNESYFAPNAINNKFVIVSGSKALFAFPPLDSLNTCINPFEKMFICQANDFIFYSQALVDQHAEKKCSLSIIHNLPIKNVCTFAKVNVSSVLVAHVNNFKFILVPKPIDFVAIKCPGKASTVHNVHGSYVFQDSCSLESSSLRIFAANIHVKNVHVSIPNFTIMELNTTLNFQPMVLPNWDPINIEHIASPPAEQWSWNVWSPQQVQAVSLPSILLLFTVVMALILYVKKRNHQTGRTALLAGLATLLRRERPRRPQPTVPDAQDQDVSPSDIVL